MARATSPILPCLTVVLLGCFGLSAHADEPVKDPTALEFFEKQVRPLFVARCQSCHGAEKQKGHLRLDSRDAILAGGDTGAAIVPGKPVESLLIEAINYGDLYKMPPKSKLPDAEIATLTRWVELGAPWPQQVTAGRSAATTSVFDLKKRAEHWSFQPLRASSPPAPHQSGWMRSPIDGYILSALEGRGLTPAPEADKQTLIRRLSFDLTGLPPTPAEVEAFLADPSPRAYETVVDRLLASPAYGERWGRHWLDLVRYAETAGHEFDYDAPDAFRYRDYVVRALNADLPYDQFVVEHVAGDLVNPPRRHPTAGFNESILGTGFYFLGEGTHSPVDLREEEASRVDNQIDVLSKTFLGLTVACARCHDHKFDAISTKDYYALSGYLQSSRHQHAFIDPPGPVQAKVAELETLKRSVRQAVGTLSSAAPRASGDGSSLLFEDFNGSDYQGWFVSGTAFGSRPSQGEELLLTWKGGTPFASSVAPGQAHSGLVSDRLEGVLRSRTFVLEKRYIHCLASGRHGRLNVVIDGFEKIRSPIYGGLTLEVGSEPLRWFTLDTEMWAGHTAYIELSDGGTVDYTQAKSRYVDGSGFLAVDEIRFSDQAAPPALSASPAVAPVDLSRIDDSGLQRDLARYRQVEATIPAPTLALAIADGTGEDDRVHIRGSTKTPGEIVPRRFLEAIAGSEQPAPAVGSGRLALARRIVDPTNPLVARVMVNRIWKHHFGQGIVPTPDDFGVMGRTPTHPELLDDLAARFMASGWSIKAMHRLIVLSSTYRMSSQPVEQAESLDPDNQLLHRMNVRRLEAEVIRDTLLAVSGRLDPTLFGPSVPPYLTSFMEGRGRPATSGPLDGDGRRSLYINVRRNFLSPMFLAFDAPSPFSTMGRRNVSNVPAQALTMLNDPFVIGQATLWSERLLARQRAGATRQEILRQMYLTAFGRPPTERETVEGLAFLDAQAGSYGTANDPRAWADLCHVLVNVKEFIYVN
ncbi:Planctomycete cytochrome C [Singulisphaera sp. GP187]|uniref:PSD1 and planctomycete cytochrome C domain-containing protein n=1 Tax=Singulisphaera sp. GP187 TaxID=1882752 RepID=UPI00092B33F6|nr:PSD1 and planctomycete cytochrome C domain-containing protein [Singulisphaera sp. GP187]SIO66021.1 Planctomycete cytochrome C [Singulisphaera sp. GP187]